MSRQPWTHQVRTWPRPGDPGNVYCVEAQIAGDTYLVALGCELAAPGQRIALLDRWGWVRKNGDPAEVLPRAVQPATQPRPHKLRVWLEDRWVIVTRGDQVGGVLGVRDA